jgi:2-isopropylmalate synthase
VLGKHSGRAAFKDKLSQLGYALSDNEFLDAFRRFKDLADAKKQVFDEDIVALVDDEVLRGHDRIQVTEVEVYCGSNGPQRAILTLTIDGEEVTAATRGNGPGGCAVQRGSQAGAARGCDAAAVRGFSGDRRNGCAGRSVVVLAEHGRTVRGVGTHNDTLVASARAYVNALNKLVVKRGRSALAA